MTHGKAKSADSLEALLRPSTVAVIGASEQPGTVGELVVRYLRKHGFPGDIYPVNPKRDTVSGLQAYPSIRDVPGPIDLVVFAVPQQHVRENITYAVEQGVGAGIIFSAGFADAGEDGRGAQEELVALARQGGMRLVGPNCVGVLNLKDSRYCGFSKIGDRERFVAGPVAIVSQSGALGGCLLDRLQDAQVGVGYMVSTGNEADVEVAEVIDTLLDDESIQVIAAFVEQFRDPSRLRAVALRAAQMGKPVVVLKTGVSQLGQRAIASHTGALAPSDAFYEGFMRQHGIIRARDLDDLFTTVMFLAQAGVPSGPRVGVLSLSGGAGALAADACARFGLELPVPSEKTQTRLGERIPAFGSIENPADTSGMTFSDPGLFPYCMESFGDDGGFDSVVSVMTAVGGEMGERMARAVAEVGDKSAVPMASVWLAGTTSDSSVDIVQSSSVATFRGIDDCFGSIARAVDYVRSRDRMLRDEQPTAAPAEVDLATVRSLLDAADGVVPEPVSAQILGLYGLKFPRQDMATSLEQAQTIAADLGGAVALKIVASGLAHKGKAGGVALGVRGPDAIREAYDGILAAVKEQAPDADIEGVLVAEMVPSGVELLVGTQHDPLFGPAVVVGMGGALVETLDDTTLRLPPFDRVEAASMLTELRAYGGLQRAGMFDENVLSGVIDVIMAVGRLATDFSGVVDSIDVNPVIVDVRDAAVWPVDALIVKAD